jgi:hypothetical protein
VSRYVQNTLEWAEYILDTLWDDQDAELVLTYVTDSLMGEQ